MSALFILQGHEPVEAELLEWAQWFETADRKVAAVGLAAMLGWRVRFIVSFLILELCCWTHP